MGDGLKSTLDIVMEKLKGLEGEPPELNDRQKERIAEIRRECEAKIAEKKILIDDKELLAKEIVALEEKRDRQIAKVHQESKP
ncbi:MAG: hypothetical protein JXD19_07400 [Deltaproteobacteria bacterium]|nr:hypothetical protein [Deltaproteobacteria bacterium]